LRMHERDQARDKETLQREGERGLERVREGEGATEQQGTGDQETERPTNFDITRE